MDDSLLEGIDGIDDVENHLREILEEMNQIKKEEDKMQERDQQFKKLQSAKSPFKKPRPEFSLDDDSFDMA